MKEWSKALKNLSILTQLGLSLIMPLLLCLFLVYRLREVFSLGIKSTFPFAKRKRKKREVRIRHLTSTSLKKDSLSR